MSDRAWTRLAAALAAAGVLWFLYDTLVAARDPALDAQSAADRAFEDGDYERALALYRERAALQPGNGFALRGVALSLMQLGEAGAALAAFDRAIAADPDMAFAWANRGILHDRMGRYDAAVADYARALELDPAVADGPHWLTRFLRKQAERPPTVADRLAYLRAELAKPPGERLLRLEDADAAQRPYTQ